jgi:hypothetical protein
VEGIERTGWAATYAILQLDDSAATGGKHTFPIGGPVERWEMFQTKFRTTYKPDDSFFQLRAKWQDLSIGLIASVAMFNDQFTAIRCEIYLHDPQTDLLLLHANKKKLSGNRATAITLASDTYLERGLESQVDLADCMAVIVRQDILVFRLDDKGRATTIKAIAGYSQVKVTQGRSLERGRGVGVVARGVGGAGDLGPGSGPGTAVGTHASHCARCRSFGYFSYGCPRPREASAASASATPSSAAPTLASTTALVQLWGNYDVLVEADTYQP